MNTKTLRPAIAMIELIFAIVIIGIVLMSAPMLISTATKSGYVAIQQEAINEAASQVNMIMGYHWDENSADEEYIPPILKVSSAGGDDDLDEEGNTSRRLGTPKESYRSFVRSDGADFNVTLPVVLGKDTGETQDDDFDDFDDFTGSTAHLVLVLEPTLNANYVETATIDINRTVAYIDDNASYNSSSITYNPFGSSTGSTNIKSITVTLTSSSGLEELDKEIILRAFSCNIGGYKLEKKDF